MKSKSEVFGIVTSIAILVLLGCGGCGGDGSSAEGGISYTGLTTPAIIDESNAVDLITGAVGGYSVGSSIGPLAVQSGQGERMEQPLTMRLIQVLEEALYRVDITSAWGGAAISGTQCESETITGDCGGSAYGYFCMDDVNGFFDGYFTFSSYCSEGVSISGRVDFSGRADLNTAEFLELDFSFENLTVFSDGYSSTLAGTIDFIFSTSPVTITMDMLLCDNSTGKVYWIANYNIRVTEGLDYTDVEISGRYYDPDYGYINIHTEESLRFYLYDAWPSQGALVAEGETGIEGSPTKARLTALSSTTYQVEVDINGDGEYNWSSGILKWSDL